MNPTNQGGAISEFEDELFIKRGRYVDVVKDPNSTTNPNFIHTYIDLFVPGCSGCNYGTSGLPTFFDVWPDPISIADTSICQGDTVHIGQSDLPGLGYTWSPAATLDDPTVADPRAFPDTTTVYTVVTTGGACNDTATVKVTVWDTAQVTSHKGTFAWCPNDDLFLTAQGGVVVQWYYNGDSILPGDQQQVLAQDTGLYQAVIQSCALGGLDTVSAYVYYNPPVISYLPADTAYLCPNGQVGLEVAGGHYYQWYKNGSFVQASFSPVFEAGSPGLYQVVVTDSCGYEETGAYTVLYYPPDPSQHLYPQGPVWICPGGDTTLYVTTDTVYAWHKDGTMVPGATDTFLQVTQAGTYEAIFQNIHGCTDSATLTVSQVAPLQGLITTVGNPLCLGDTALLQTTQSGTSYQWSSAAPLSCTTCPNPKSWPQQDQEVYLELTDSQGCTHYDTTTLEVDILPQLTMSSDTIICPGQQTQLSVAPTNLTGPPVFQWQPANTLLAPTAFTPIAHPTQTTTYTVTFTQGACTAQDSVTVTVQGATLTATATPQHTCDTATVQLQATTNQNLTNYQWQPQSQATNPNQQTTTATVNQTTTFTVTATDPQTGCTYNDTTKVTVNATPAITISGPAVICQGGEVQLTANGGAQYQWATHPSLSCTACPTPTVNPATTTTYTVTGTDPYGCTATDTHRVEVLQQATLTVTPDTTICFGTSVQLTATGGDTLNWSPNYRISCTDCPNPIADPWGTTTYTVTTSVAGGCSDTAEVTITVLPPPGDPVSGYYYDLCLGDTLQLNATGGTTYNWTPKTNIIGDQTSSPQVFPADTTTYVLDITYGPNDCPWQDSVEVQVNKGTGTLPDDTAICEGQSATLTATGYQTYQWQSSGQLPCTSCNEITIDPATTTEYTLTATSAQGCDVTKTITVTVHPNPAPTVTGPDTLCAGTTGQLTVTGVANGNYQWQPQQLVTAPQSATTNTTPAQTTIYTVTVTDANGCTAQETKTVEVVPAPTLTTSNDTIICEEATAILSASGATSYQWQPSQLVTDPQSPTTTATPTQTTVFTVTGTNTHGCSNAATITVTVSPAPAITLSPGNLATICKGDTVTLEATDNNAHQWAPATQVDCPTCDQVQVGPQQTTTYTVTATSTTGCTNTDTIRVEVHTVDVTISGPAQVCPNTQTTLTASGAGTYFWQPGSQTTATITPTLTQAATFTVTGTTAGCSDTALITVTPFDTVDPAITGPDEICEGETATWAIGPATTVTWQPDGTGDNPIVLSPASTTTYTATVTDSNGCMYVRTKTLTVNPRPQIDVGMDLTIGAHEQLQLNATGASTYLWQPPANLSDPAVANPIFEATKSEVYIYEVTGTSAEGCTDTDTLTITVEPGVELTIPTALSPNGDGRNDRFTVTLPAGYTFTEISIYTRWGNLAFQTKDPTQSWDGTIDGRPAPVGSYAVLLRYLHPDGRQLQYSGNVTVVR